VGLLVNVVVAFIGFGIWFLSAHGILAITGGTEHGGGRTLQALSYGSAANVFVAIPCLGMYVTPIALVWWCVSATRMLVHGQRVHWARAAVATSFLPVALLGIWIAFAVYTFRSAGMRSVAVGPVAAVSRLPLAGGEESAERVYKALRHYADTHSGIGPRHAVRLITGGLLRPDEIVVNTSALNPGQIRIGQLDLNEIAALPRQQGDELAASAEDEMPPGMVAHRFGDYVFCYHGVDLRKPPKDLWLLVLAPRRLTLGSFNQQNNWVPDEVFAVTATGEVVSIEHNSIESELAEQNRLRRRHHLAPLPALDSITAEAPATAPASAPE